MFIFVLNSCVHFALRKAIVGPSCQIVSSSSLLRVIIRAICYFRLTKTIRRKLDDTWPSVTIIQACTTTLEFLQTPSLSSFMKSAMPSKPSLLLRLSSVLLQLKSGPPLLSSLRRDGNFHTAVVLWMACMWRSSVLGILALCTETTRSPLSSWPWSTQTMSSSELMSALMVPVTMPVYTMGQNWMNAWRVRHI